MLEDRFRDTLLPAVVQFFSLRNGITCADPFILTERRLFSTFPHGGAVGETDDSAFTFIHWPRPVLFTHVGSDVVVTSQK